MKKIIEKIIVILLVVSTLINVVLPSAKVYAEQKETVTIDGKTYYKFLPDESRTYQWNVGITQGDYVSAYMARTMTREEALSYEFIYIESGDKNFIKTESTEEMLPNEDHFNVLISIPSKTTITENYGYQSKIYNFDLNRGSVYYINKDFKPTKVNNKSLIELLEEGLTAICYGLANGMQWLTALALGESVTIDDLVFNKFNETKIDFFDNGDNIPDEEKSTILYGVYGTTGLRDVINDWYTIFLKIAIMGYMVILVYMGIRIMLTSTAEKKAGYKKLFVDWVIGVAILFLVPYGMKYIIKMNNGIVSTIESNKGYEDNAKSPVEDVASTPQPGFEEVDIDTAIKWDEGTDYMSYMGRLARDSKKLVFGICFLILTWQLIALIVHYYKRLFMTAFLIVLFPLVALSYAIDKIADGKSQAFNTWMKEFIINVFVQSFHAIVYVFAMSAVYSSAGLLKGGTYDFILIIIGITFLFSGEKIIREIFGQVSTAGTMGTLKDSAMATYAKFAIVTKTLKNVRERTVGEKSIPRRAVYGIRGINAARKKEKAFDSLATYSEEYHIGDRLPDAPSAPKDENKDALKNYSRDRKYFDAAAVLNNPNSFSYAEKVQALERLRKLAEENPNHKVFKKGNLMMTVGQLAAFADLDKYVQRSLQDPSKEIIDIENTITARIGYMFHGESEDYKKQMVNTYMEGLHVHGATSLVSRKTVKDEITDAAREVENIRKSVERIPAEKTDERSVYEADRNYTAQRITDRYVRRDEDRTQIERYATCISIVNNRENGATNAEVWNATKELEKAMRGGNSEVKQMIENELTEDIFVFKHIYAKQLAKADESDVSSDPLIAKRIIREAQETVNVYENDTRDGYKDTDLSIHEVIGSMSTNKVDKFKEDIKFRLKSTSLSEEEINQRRSMQADEALHLEERYESGADVDDLKRLCEAISILKNRKEEIDTELELYEAARYIKESSAYSESSRRIVENELGESADVILRAVSEKIVEEQNKDGIIEDTMVGRDASFETVDRAMRETNTFNTSVYDELDNALNNLYNNRQEEMRELTSDFAEDYLVRNNVDLTEGYRDLNQLTLDGYTREELNVMKTNEILKAVSRANPLIKNQTSDNAGRSFLDTIMKERLIKEEEERTKVRRSVDDYKRRLNFNHTAMDEVARRRKARKDADESHYYGDM